MEANPVSSDQPPPNSFAAPSVLCTIVVTACLALGAWGLVADDPALALQVNLLHGVAQVASRVAILWCGLGAARSEKLVRRQKGVVSTLRQSSRLHPAHGSRRLVPGRHTRAHIARSGMTG